MRYRLRTLLIVVAICSTSPALAELWPTFEKYVGDSALIVHCRTEIKNERVRFKIIETWKGVYSPELFYYTPEEGYLYTGYWHGNESPKDAGEVIFFFTIRNQPRWTEGKLLDHSTAFVVTNGKLIWASTADFGRQEYTLAEFRVKVLNQARLNFAAATKAKILEEQAK